MTIRELCAVCLGRGWLPSLVEDEEECRHCDGTGLGETVITGHYEEGPAVIEIN